MPIASLDPGLLPTRHTGTDAAVASAAERGPGNRTRPLVARVFEGEVVPRSRAAELHADAAGRKPPDVAGGTSAPDTPLPSTGSPKTLFYLLHSSDALLSGKTIGGHVDQAV